jgi:DNA-binding GntR family transcriptional regulator
MVSTALSSPAPLRRVTLSNQLAERLREDILSGALAANVQLNEKELALAFGVSRGPLREAMQRLIQEGLLRSEPHRGVFVVDFSERDLADIFLVRAAIESAAIRRILSIGAQEAVASRLHRISERMDKAVRAGRWKDGGALDFEFHRALVDGADSERLSRTYVTVQAETRLCLHRLMGGYRSSQDLAEEHFRLAGMLATSSLEAILHELDRHFGDPIAILRRARRSMHAADGNRQS